MNYDNKQPYQYQNQENNKYSYKNNKQFNQNKFNPNVINELRDKDIKITWKNKEIIEDIHWEYFKVLNTFYSYGEGWLKLLATSNEKNEDLPQELLDCPIFVRFEDIKYFMITLEK
jgi:ATP-dependent Zn protease